MSPVLSTMTMASGADSSRPRNLASARRRSVRSRIELLTRMPSSVFSGLRLISTGNSSPFFSSPYSSSPAPMPRAPRLGKVAVPMTRMLGPEALGHQHFDRLAEQFLARIAKQLLGLGIDQHDRPGLVDDDHRIGRRLQESAEQ